MTDAAGSCTARPGRPRRRSPVPRRAGPPTAGWPGPRPCHRCSLRSIPTVSRARCPAAGPPIGPQPRDRPERPGRAAAGEGLLLRVDQETVELPRQVGLALRGDRPLGALALHPPPLDIRDRHADTVDRTAGGAALDPCVVSRPSSRSGGHPPPPLRSVVGVRVPPAAREIDTDGPSPRSSSSSRQAIVAPSDGVTPDWRPPRSPTFGWPVTGTSLVAPGPNGWSSRGCGLVGHKDDTGTDQRPVRRCASHWPRAASRADGLAELPPGHAAATPTQLADALAWRAPAVVDGCATRSSPDARGAATLSVVALDAPATRGAHPYRADRSSPRHARHPARRSTMCCCRPTSPRSRPVRWRPGWRASWTWLRRRVREGAPPLPLPSRRSDALDAGSAADLHHLFATRSATPGAAGVTYLVDDVARRHGRLRGGAAAHSRARR